MSDPTNPERPAGAPIEPTGSVPTQNPAQSGEFWRVTPAEPVAPVIAEPSDGADDVADVSTSAEAATPAAPSPSGAEPADYVFEGIAEDTDTLEEEAKPRLTVRGAAVVGGRVVAGTVGVGIAAVVIAAATLIPLPVISATPPSELVTPVATGQQLVCAGPVLRLGDEAGQDATTASAIGRAAVRYSSSAGTVSTAPLSTVGSEDQQSAPLVLSTPPNAADPSEQVLVAGAQSQTANADDFVGLAAASCTAVAGELWLAAGSTAVGRTTLITLSNPTEVPATVDLQIFGENGPVSAPGTSGIIIAPNAQRVLSLAGFVPGLQSPVVRVQSQGGQVAASVQQSVVRGLEPGGVDIAGAAGMPSLRSVIPGFTLVDIAGLESRMSELGYDDLRPVLRLFVPGDKSAVATVKIVPEDAASAGRSFTVNLDGGVVDDVTLGQLGDGNYTVVVESDVPAVASLRYSNAVTGTGIPSDFVWLAAAPVLSEEVLLTVPVLENPVLHLANPTTTDAEVTLTSQSGEGLTVTVPAGASALLPVKSNSTYDMAGFTTLHATVTSVGSGLAAGFAVQPRGQASTPILVVR